MGLKEAGSQSIFTVYLGQNMNGFHLIFKMPNFPQSIKCHVIEEMKVVAYRVT